VRFLDLPPKASSKNVPLSERLSVETREWTAQAKAEVAYQLGNVNVQSIDPLLQLAASPEEMWNIVAEICQGRAGGDNGLKPPISITPFKCLQGLSYNERLDLITAVHSGDLTWADASQKAESLKINKQILAAWLADLSTTAHRLTRRELIELVGEEVILQERERWFSEFKKLGKGKNKRPDGFTPYIRKLTHQLASEKPLDKSKRTEKMWSWEKNNTSVKSYHQTLGIKGRTPNITYNSCMLPFFSLRADILE